MKAARLKSRGSALGRDDRRVHSVGRRARRVVVCPASSSSEWLEESCRSLKLREDALVGAPEGPWRDLRNKNKNEEWRFSATTLGRILGDEPDVLDRAEWSSAAERTDLASYTSDLAEDLKSNPNYRQVLVKDGIIVSGGAGESGSGGLVVATASGVEGTEDESALRFLDEAESKWIESSEGDSSGKAKHFFHHLGSALARDDDGRGKEHLVLVAKDTAGSEDPHILHVFQVIPRKKANSTACWSPAISVLVQANQNLVLIEEVVYEGEGNQDATESARIVLPRTRAFLHEKASLKHTVVHSGAKPRDVNIRSVHVTQSQSSKYDMLETRVAFGDAGAEGGLSNASLSRVEVEIEQIGEETETLLKSLSLVSTDGAAEESDSVGTRAPITHELRTHARLAHRGGTIDQVAKMVASGGSSTCIFDGKVDVERYAQETDAAQIARGLLLTRKATINARPNLRIQADNVVASHGCTIADLEEDQVFYLASRGVDEKTARSVLIGSFVREITQEFTKDLCFDRLAKRVDDAVENALLLDA